MESPTQSGALVVAVVVVVDGLVTGAGDATGVAGFAEVPEEGAGAACGDPHAVNVINPAARRVESRVAFDIDVLSPRVPETLGQPREGSADLSRKRRGLSLGGGPEASRLPRRLGGVRDYALEFRGWMKIPSADTRTPSAPLI